MTGSTNLEALPNKSAHTQLGFVALRGSGILHFAHEAQRGPSDVPNVEGQARLATITLSKWNVSRRVI